MGEKTLNVRDVTVIIAHDERRPQTMLDRCVLSIPAVCQVIVATEGNKSASRNTAALKATGQVLVFLDDDVELRPGCFEELLKPFQDLKVGIVGGVNVAFKNIGRAEKVGAALLASPLTMFKSAARYAPRGDIRETDESEIVGCIMAVRTQAFQAAGGFPVDIIPCEENVLVARVQLLGWKVIYDPFAVAYHRRPRVFREYSRAVFSYGRGRGVMIRKLGQAGGPRIFWRPSLLWLYYAAGFLVHYVSYISGLIWGLLKGE